jgi:hypothetical protein
MAAVALAAFSVSNLNLISIPVQVKGLEINNNLGMKKSIIDGKQYLNFYESLVGSQAIFRRCWQVHELDLGMVCPYPGIWESKLKRWLNAADTDLDLVDSIVEYVQRQETVMMEEVVQEAPRRFWFMGLSQDKIGWQRFLKGMILTEITILQHQFQALNRSHMSLEKWTSGLIIWLLEITHCQ